MLCCSTLIPGFTAAPAHSWGHLKQLHLPMWLLGGWVGGWWGGSDAFSPRIVFSSVMGTYRCGAADSMAGFVLSPQAALMLRRCIQRWYGEQSRDRCWPSLNGIFPPTLVVESLQRHEFYIIISSSGVLRGNCFKDESGHIPLFYVRFSFWSLNGSKKTERNNETVPLGRTASLSKAWYSRACSSEPKSSIVVKKKNY